MGKGYKKGVVSLSEGPRNVLENSGEYSCHGCFSRKLEIDLLREENQKLKHRVKVLEGGKEVVAIGAHTPPSQRPFKEKSSDENVLKQGGAVVGHKGNGRKSLKTEDTDAVVTISAPADCPDCGNPLSPHSHRQRSVLDAVEMKICKKIYDVERSKCGNCKKIHETRLPLFPRALYSNALLSQVAVMHYVHGIPIGRACTMLGKEVNPSGMLAALQRVANKWEPALDLLIADYRESKVKHADETGWRIDGQPGWSWLFCTPSVSIFECRETRSSSVPKRIFGTERTPGVLIVDRFSAYNKLPCEIQYCYAHLLREVKKLDIEFPDDEEVANFTADFGHLLAEAMRLGSRTLDDSAYYRTATEIAGQIKALAYKSTKNVGILSIQRIFQTKESRLFQWVLSRDVPAHNNRAEREVRQTVIARKVSFGSQSARGAKTRSTMMSILFTAKKRIADQSIENWFTSALDKMALNDTLNPAKLIPPNSC